MRDPYNDPMIDAFIYDGLRTPFGRHAGALAPVRPDDLLGDLVGALVERSPFAPDRFEDVIAGCTNQAGEDCRNVARRAGLLAGLPVEVAGMTVNRLCASGLAAVVDASRAVACGQGDLFVAGGVESMSRAPFVMAKAERAYGRQLTTFDTTLGSRFPNRRATAAFGDHAMFQTAEEVAKDLGIGRGRATASPPVRRRATRRRSPSASTPASSIRWWCRGRSAGRRPRWPATSTRGPAPVRRSSRRCGPWRRAAWSRPATRPASTTARRRSSSGRARRARRRGAAPLARVVSAAAAGVEPRVMGLGPVPASKKALARAGLTLADMDVIEINEAFATQVLGCLKLLEIDQDDSRVNPNGGAIAIGHPLGASGARLTLTAVRQLQRVEGRYALVTLCIGVGQGLAAVLERVD